MTSLVDDKRDVSVKEEAQVTNHLSQTTNITI